MADDEGEIWFYCDDCDGTGSVEIPEGEDEHVTSAAECPGCGGDGMNEGEASDLDLPGVASRRVPEGEF